jgi:hypothetical protein
MNENIDKNKNVKRKFNRNKPAYQHNRNYNNEKSKDAPFRKKYYPAIKTANTMLPRHTLEEDKVLLILSVIAIGGITPFIASHSFSGATSDYFLLVSIIFTFICGVSSLLSFWLNKRFVLDDLKLGQLYSKQLDTIDFVKRLCFFIAFAFYTIFLFLIFLK